MLNSVIENAYQVLEGKELSKEIAFQLMALEKEDILDMISLANKVKTKFVPESHICSIMNAKSGVCNENCKFCAQSVHHNSIVEKYPLSNTKTILEKATETYIDGIPTFGIVTSGVGFRKVSKEFLQITDSIEALHNKFPDKKVCASIGLLSEETAAELGKHGIYHYNINIQTNPAKYNELIADSHSVDERIETIKLLKKNKIGVCCGGIFGLGETPEDRVEFAFALKELDVDVIPLNVLIPVDGTPLENQKCLDISEIAKAFAMVRLVNPHKIIKFAAGRETRLKDFQGLLMLAGVNGFISGGYLTTRGRSVNEDKIFEQELKRF